LSTTQVNAAHHNHFGQACGCGRGNVQSPGCGYDHNRNENFKNSFFIRNGKIMKRIKRVKVDKVAKLVRIYVIDLEAKVIDLVPVVHQSI